MFLSHNSSWLVVPQRHCLPATAALLLVACSASAFLLQSDPSSMPHIGWTERRLHKTTPSATIFLQSRNCAVRFVHSTKVSPNQVDILTNEVTSTTTKDAKKMVSPVLQQVYPALLENIQCYGHANIPLGSAAGRQCATLRRLRIQEKLVESDIAHLDELNFTWHSLEDVYQQQKEDFMDLYQRLQQYGAQQADGNVSPPKKYPADPELGAWVTALRRLYNKNNLDENPNPNSHATANTECVDPHHVELLNALNFEWTSPRQCGSKFMQTYRELKEQLQTYNDDNNKNDTVWNDPTVVAWVAAQQVASLSETRKHYMVQLLGPDWTSFGK